MPTYTIFGATGATGSAIIRSLQSKSPENLTLNLFVRSESKLRQMFPDLETTTAFKVNVIEGVPSDAALTQKCLEDVDVVFACVGSNISTPGMSLIRDTTAATIEALQFHRNAQGSTYKTPTILLLRSGSLNPVYKAQIPWIGHQVVMFCLHHVYADLARASDLLASTTKDSPGLLEYIYVDPPSLHDADGRTTTGHKLILDEKQEGALSYADLGAAFCELAERKGEFLGKAVGVSATGAVNLTWGTLISYMATGAKGRIWG